MGCRLPGDANAALARDRAPAAAQQSVEGHQHARRLVLPDDQHDLRVDPAAHSRDQRLRPAPPGRRPVLADVLDGGVAVLRSASVVRRPRRAGQYRARLPRYAETVARRQPGRRHGDVAVVDSRCRDRLGDRAGRPPDAALGAHRALAAAQRDLRRGADGLDRVLQQRLCARRRDRALAGGAGLRDLPRRGLSLRSDHGRRAHLQVVLPGHQPRVALAPPADLVGGVQSRRAARGAAREEPARHVGHPGVQPGGPRHAAAVPAARPHAAQPRRPVQRPVEASDGQLERSRTWRRQQHVLYQEQPGRPLRPQHPTEGSLPGGAAGLDDAEPASGQQRAAGAQDLHPGDHAQLPGRGVDPVRELTTGSIMASLSRKIRSMWSSPTATPGASAPVR